MSTGKKAEFMVEKHYAPVLGSWKFYLKEALVGCLAAAIGGAVGFVVLYSVTNNWQQPSYCIGRFLCGIAEKVLTVTAGIVFVSMLGAVAGVAIMGRHYRVQGNFPLTLLCGAAGPAAAIIAAVAFGTLSIGPLITLVIGVIVTGFGAAAGYNIRARVKS